MVFSAFRTLVKKQLQNSTREIFYRSNFPKYFPLCQGNQCNMAISQIKTSRRVLCRITEMNIRNQVVCFSFRALIQSAQLAWSISINLYFEGKEICFVGKTLFLLFVLKSYDVIGYLKPWKQYRGVLRYFSPIKYNNIYKKKSQEFFVLNCRIAIDTLGANHDNQI